MLPDFVIIGAQKSASTFLQLSLADHPHVYMPHSETPFFQDPDYDPNRLDILESYFEDADLSNVRRLGIKRPDYLARSECPERIHRHIPNAKLIAVLRDPVERLISAYYHYVKTGFLPPVHINKGLPKILSGEWTDKYPRSEELIEYGMYSKHLKRYLRYFDRQQMKILIYGNLKKNNLKKMKEIYEYIDVDTEYIPASIDSKPKSSVYNIGRLKVIRRANILINEYYNDGKRMKRIPVKKNVAKYVKYAITRCFYHIQGILVEKSKKPKLSTQLRGRVNNKYYKDISRLENIIDVSLDKWGS